MGLTSKQPTSRLRPDPAKPARALRPLLAGPSDSTVATPSQRIPLDEGEVLRQVSKDLAGVSMELEHFMLRVKGTGQESCPDRKEFEDTAPTGSLQLSLGFPAGMQVTEIADHHFALEFSVDRLDTLYLHKVDDDTTPEGHILREPHGEALFERPPMLGTITLAVKLMSTKTHVVLWRVPSSCQGGSRASTVFPRLDVASDEAQPCGRRGQHGVPSAWGRGRLAAAHAGRRQRQGKYGHVHVLQDEGLSI